MLTLKTRLLADVQKHKNTVMSRSVKNAGRNLPGKMIPRSIRKFQLSDDTSPKFLHQVGSQDNPSQKTAFNLTERSVYSTILGDLAKQRTAYASRRRNLNWGKYIQNHETPDLIQDLSLTPTQGLSVPEDISHIPYPYSSLESIKVKAARELTYSSSFLVAAKVGEGLGEAYRKKIVESLTEDCQEVDVKVLALKPILFRAFLWSLSQPGANVDEFWTGGFINSHQDTLADKVKAEIKIASEDNATLLIYFFQLQKDSYSVMEELFQPYQEVSQFLGSRISPEAVGGSQHLKETLINITTPWVLTGDEQTKSLAKVLQGLASFGLVNGSKAPGGGIYVV